MPALAIILVVWLTLGVLQLWRRASWPVIVAHYLGPVFCTTLWVASLWGEDSLYMSIWDQDWSLLLRLLAVGCLASTVGSLLAAAIVWLDRKPTQRK